MMLIIEKGHDVGGKAKARCFPQIYIFPFKQNCLYRPLIWKCEEMYSASTSGQLLLFKGVFTFAISKFFYVLWKM